MKDNFSFKRYQMLLTKELKERSSIILKLAGIMSLVIFGIWLTSILITGGKEISPLFRFGMMSTLLVVAMIIAPFNLYKSYNHPKKGIDFALLPASVCEKYLSMLTIVVIITPLVIILSLVLTDIFLSLITPSVFPGFAFNANNLGKIDISSIYEIFILQWGFIFGNFLFKKSKVTKSIFTAIGIYLVLGLILASTVKVVYAEEINQMASFSVQINSLDDLLNSPVLEKVPAMRLVMYSIYAITYFIIPVGSLSGTFLKMKNQQY
ncbi:MAG: hypothetical protein M0R37_10920 [Bacteroidales bacterium]|nr:hypothetical protein [Bacteroidales bacterium]